MATPGASEDPVHSGVHSPFAPKGLGMAYPLADVVVVRGDPTREITALWDVLDACQAGRHLERSVR